MKAEKSAKHRDIFRLVDPLILFFSANCIVFCVIPETTELGMEDLTIHYPLLDYFNYLTIHGERGDYAEFGNKTEHRSWFFSPIVCGQKIPSNSIIHMQCL